MSIRSVLNLVVFVLTGLQVACGDSNFTSNQAINQKSEVSSNNNIVNNEPTAITPETNTTNHLPDETKPIFIENEITNPANENTENSTISEVINTTCRPGLIKKCVPTTQPPKPSIENLVEPIIEALTEKICIDTDGDGAGKLESTTTTCTGNKQLDRHISTEVFKLHNINSRKSVQINNQNCVNFSTMTAALGCFEKVNVNSPLFNDYARSKGITKAGAIAKFYPAGNTLEPLNRTLILVSPYNPLASKSIDFELNWLFTKSKSDGSKLPTLLNYLHKNGISVLYVSFGHLANTSLPVVEKSQALAQIIERFDAIRKPYEGNPNFEKINLMGLSLGGVVAKKALTILERKEFDHNVNLYLSMDSPHLGAHVPLGLQYLPDAISKVFAYAKSKTSLAGIFNVIIDDIFDMDFVTTPLAQGANVLGQASEQSGSFISDYFNNIPSNELIVYSTLAPNGLHKKEYIQMKRDTAVLPKKTFKNIAIANGSITGVNLSKQTAYFDVTTSETNKVKLSLFVNPRGRSNISSYAWLEFPDRNQLFAGSRTYDFTYKDTVQSTEDNIPCGTTTDIIKGAELGINLALSQNWRERLRVHNYHTCFIPTASAVMSLDGNAFRNGPFSSRQSTFHEVIGSSKNTEHMFFSVEITEQIISKFESYRKQK